MLTPVQTQVHTGMTTRFGVESSPPPMAICTAYRPFLHQKQAKNKHACRVVKTSAMLSL